MGIMKLFIYDLVKSKKEDRMGQYIKVKLQEWNVQARQLLHKYSIFLISSHFSWNKRGHSGLF